MRYLIDDSRVEPEESLAVYRAVLRWAAIRSDRFALSIDPAVYDDPGEFSVLIGLSRTPPSIAAADSQEIRIEGTPDENFIRVLTGREAPPGAVAGDLSPCEDTELYRGSQLLYGCYDYGRTQILVLEDSDIEDLQTTIRQHSFDWPIIVPAPRYIGES
jgi:hypothetical protein